mmetsp:Transcript_90002/g.249989  ORF Transcript_90002/g.249989 Transcript_90002/m.249989 type:complete len:289 (+) Transcript_90002:1740-2606(+)
MAHGVKAGGREPVGHEEEHADPGIGVVAPPLVLQAAVELEVLGRGAARGRRAPCARMELGHLVVLVPPGDVALLGGCRTLGLLGVGSVTLPRPLLRVGLLGRRCDEGDAEHVGGPGPLERIAGLPCLVKLLRRGDGQANMTSKHVCTACLGTCGGVHGEPVEGDQKHQRRADVGPVEAHEPTWRRRPMHTEPARHDELKVQHEENDTHDMVEVLLGDCERRHIADVLAVHRCLLHGKGIPRGVPPEAQLVVEHVVRPVVLEGTDSNRTGSHCRSCGGLGICRHGRKGT